MKRLLLCLMAILVSVAAQAAPPTPDCTARLPENMTYETLQTRIEICSIRKIEDLLAVFPQAHLDNYTVMHEARGRQRATLDAPRAILFGKDAKLIVAFNGDPKLNAYEDLELIQFRDSTKTFEFRTITFPEGDSANLPAAEFSVANPPMCINCHRRDNPRPNWDGYLLWPGAFGAEDDFIFRQEGNRNNEDGRRFERFLASGKKTGRYKYLAEKYGKDSVIPNSIFGIRLADLNNQNIVRSLEENPKVLPFRFALVGAAVCEGETNSEVPAFIPAKLLAKAKRSYAELTDDTEKANNESFMFRVMRLQRITPSAPETPRVTKYSQDGAAGRSIYGRSEAAVVAGFRLVMEELLSIPISQWSLELGHRSYLFADGYGGLARIEAPLVKALLKDDPAFLALFKPGRGKDGSHLPYQVPRAELCQRLAKRSLELLSSH